jgi:hypothetical protein
MPSTASQLAALGNDLQFQLRVRSIMLQVAATVAAEAPQDPDTRRNYARQVIQNPELAQRAAIPVANMTNVIAATTTYDFETGQVVTDITDAALFGQITAGWDLLSGNI